jgi:undecaprenyl-diphosphatase
MELVGYPGNGIIAVVLGATVWTYGHWRADHKAKQLAYAILLSQMSVGVLTLLLKYSFQLPRPFGFGYGFPSGDTATAFALAAAAGTAYPVTAPMLHFFALLAALSRLYVRAHYVWDVIGGALLGAACGYWSARKSIPRPKGWRPSYAWMSAWIPGATLALVGLSFFWLLEQAIARHKVDVSAAAVASTQLARVDFGTPSAQPRLLGGWSPNRIWPVENIPFNWVEGLRASISLTLGQRRDARMIVRVQPYRAQGFLCERARVTINGILLSDFFFEQGWHNYLLEVPHDLLSLGDNRIDFAFAYVNQANWRGMNPGRKPLSVAFHTLYLSAN